MKQNVKAILKMGLLVATILGATQVKAGESHEAVMAFSPFLHVNHLQITLNERERTKEIFKGGEVPSYVHFSPYFFEELLSKN